MNPLPHDQAIQDVARRVVWWMEPDEALADPVHVVLQALEFATPEDMAVVIDAVGMEGIKEALDNARPGILSGRSWSYWHVMTGTYPAPEMLERRFDMD